MIVAYACIRLQLCTNVLSSCFEHEMHEMSNHNKYKSICFILLIIFLVQKNHLLVFSVL